MKVAVFGSGGFIGHSLVLKLESLGFECLRFSSQDLSGLCAQTGHLSKSFNKRQLQDCDYVIYLSHSPFYKDPSIHREHLFQVNAHTPAQLAKICLEVGVRRFLFFSTSSVYQSSWRPIKEEDALDEHNTYPLSKREGERKLQLLSDLELVIARPFYVYGPGQKDKLVPEITRRILAGEEIFLEEGPDDQDGIQLSFLYIDDLTQMIAAIIMHGLTGIFNLASPESVSIRSLSMMIAQKLNRKAQFKIQASRKGDYISDNHHTQKHLHQDRFISLDEGLTRFLVNQKCW